MALTLDGSLGVTFPVTAGSASAVQASSGRVLQVVNTLVNTYTSTTSTSFTTVLTTTITPSNASNKVLILCNANGITGYFNITLNNNAGTVLAYLAQYASNIVYSSSSLTYLDSPATTSAISYTIRLASTSAGNAARINDYSTNATTSTLTLMEISA